MKIDENIELLLKDFGFYKSFNNDWVHKSNKYYLVTYSDFLVTLNMGELEYLNTLNDLEAFLLNTLRIKE